MSVKLCTAEFMLSDTSGVGMRRNWYPRIVAERFLESTKDGEIKRSPDPVTMIDGDLTWYNNSPDPQAVVVFVHRAPRSVVVQNPSTVIITDAWTFAAGVNPTADVPSVNQDTFGGRLQIDRPSVAADAVLFGRLFLDADDCQTYVDVGVVQSKEQLHFRYVAAVQTPGVWTSPSEFEPRWEAQARWTRLLALAAPVEVV